MKNNYRYNRQSLLQFLSGKKNNRGEEIFEFWLEKAKTHPDYDLIISPNEKKILKSKLKSKIDQTIDKDTSTTRIEIARHSYRSSGFILLKVAAVLILVFGIIFIYSRQFELPAEEIVEAPVIEDRMWSNPLGKLSKITLPDQSVVWLNTLSTIEYNTNFGIEHRNIKLKGEAFFDVKHDPSKPFIIQTPRLVTKVLGTSFNVKAYPDDLHEEITVESGKVEIAKSEAIDTLRQTDHFLRLSASEIARYNSSENYLQVSRIDVSNVRSWINGNIYFQNTEMWEIARTIERMYDVKINFANTSLKKQKVTFKQKAESLKITLDALSYITGMEYVKNDNEITFKKKINS
ncbi:MAG: FecR family protein [Cyclobacteriaceae bacterium]|nr:FecR family protein [Cyclobacteriaceae bacterium]